MKELKRMTLGKQMLEAIVEMLVSGGYKTGDQLPTEKEMAAFLGVARNSAREALKALALADLIESTPGKGTFLKVDADTIVINPNGTLRALNNYSLKELMQVRNMFEVEAAGLAAERAVVCPEEFEEFRNIWNAMEVKLKGRIMLEDEGYNFHRGIVRLAGNRLLETMLEPVWIEVRRAFDNIFLVQTEEEFRQEEQDHLLIYEAISQGRAEEARKLMRSHLLVVSERFSELLK